MSEKKTKETDTAFLDLKFFLGLIFVIYGLLISVTGVYYVLNPILSVDSSINIYWGLIMFLVGIINYFKSNKPKNWNKAFAIAGIENIEKRLKSKL